MQVKQFELQTSPGGPAGDLGFKIMGRASDDSGRLARVWVRRKKGTGRYVWTRYLEPVAASAEWEAQVHVIRGTGALTRVDFSAAQLESLTKAYAFPTDDPDFASLAETGVDDPVYNLVRDWVLKMAKA